MKTGSDGEPGNTPVVSNLLVSQRTAPSKLVEIHYDLTHADGLPSTISLEISSNDGVSWDVPAINVSGDIGTGINPGSNKLIIWNAGLDYPGIINDQMKVRIIADDGE